jgi:transcriptional regulator of acetoin/glycerol metabolism
MPRRHRVATYRAELAIWRGSVAAAARALGLGKTTLWYRLRALGLLGEAADLRRAAKAWLDERLGPADKRSATLPWRGVRRRRPRRTIRCFLDLGDERFDRAAVLRAAIDAAGGRTGEAASALGVHRQTVYCRLREYGLSRYPAEVRARWRDTFAVP